MLSRAFLHAGMGSSCGEGAQLTFWAEAPSLTLLGHPHWTIFFQGCWEQLSPYAQKGLIGTPLKQAAGPVSQHSPIQGAEANGQGSSKKIPEKKKFFKKAPPHTISFNTAPQSVHKALRLFCRVEDNPSPSCSLANIIFLLRHKIYSFSKCYSESRWGRIFFF